MRLKNYFGPKWKHSDPDIRLAAVETLDESDLATLREIVENDGDLQVRMAALSKIIDEDTLGAIAANNSEENVRSDSLRRLQNLYFGRILAATDEHHALRLLDQLTDQGLLAELACQSSHPEVRTAAVTRVQRSDLLVKITQGNCGLQVGMAAVDKVCDLNALQEISQSASNKKVTKAAEIKVDALRMDSEPGYRLRMVSEELDTACQRLESAIEQGGDGAIDQVRGETEALFNRLDPERTHPLRMRLTTAAERLEKMVAVRDRIRAARAELHRLCQEAARLKGAGGESVADPKALEKLDDMIAAWAAVDARLLPDPEYKILREKFEISCAAFRHHIEAAREEAARRRQAMEELEGLIEEIESLAGVGNPAAGQEKWERLCERWRTLIMQCHEPHLLTERFKKACSVRDRSLEDIEAQKKQKNEDAAKQLAELCEVMEKAAGNATQKGIIQEVRSARRQWRRLGRLSPMAKAQLTDRFKAAGDKFDERWAEVLELRKWERWANLKKKEELCSVVEALAERETLDGLARSTRNAQQQWRKIGPVERPQSEPVWQRFLAACDADYQRCLERKTELYEEVRLASALDDMHKAARRIQELQKEWNRIGPLPKSMEKELQHSFRQTCNGFFEKRRAFFKERDEKYRENLERKKALCRAAEGVADSTEWLATAEHLKDLQQQWQAVGPVSKKQSQKIWRRFRGACDAFFQRLEAEKPNNLAKKESLCRKVEEMMGGLDDQGDNIESVARELMEAQKEWKAIGPVPQAAADDVWNRFSSICDAFFEKRKERLAKLKTDQEQNREIKEGLVRQAELLVGATDLNATAEQLKALQKQWQKIGSAGWKADKKLWSRFRAACDRFFSRRQAFFDEKDHAREENRERKESICLTVEMLVRLLVPDAGISALDGVPPAEQLNMAIALKSEIIVPGNAAASWKRAMAKVKDAQEQWRGVGPAPARVDSILWQRFKAALDLFYTEARQRRTERPAG